MSNFCLFGLGCSSSAVIVDAKGGEIFWLCFGENQLYVQITVSQSLHLHFMSLPSGHEKHISNSSDNEPDEWDIRIEKGGCAREHYKLQDCYIENKDWRKCKEEVCPLYPHLIVDGSIQDMLGSKN